MKTGRGEKKTAKTQIYLRQKTNETAAGPAPAPSSLTLYGWRHYQTLWRRLPDGPLSPWPVISKTVGAATRLSGRSASGPARVRAVNEEASSKHARASLVRTGCRRSS